MSAPLGSRREIAGSFSNRPDFVCERCAGFLHTGIQTKDQSAGNDCSLQTIAMHMRRNMDYGERTSALLRKKSSVHQKIVIPAGE
jgi:hypothetical protein